MLSRDSSLANLLSDLEPRLHTFSDTPLLDAQVLLAHVLSKPRSWILAHPEAHLSPEQFENLVHTSARLEHGEPLPYVLGHWEFYGMYFLVTPQVLIPRPETELLVEHALKWLHLHPQQRWAADIGTGSGCIAIVLAAQVSNLGLLATDVSRPALEVASTNAQKQDVADRIEFIQADLLDIPSHKPFDLLCANLPYIPSAKLPTLTVTNNEPSLALDGGRDGLELIRRLLHHSHSHMAPGGLVLLEIEYTQGLSALNLAREVFPAAQVRIHRDLSNLDRLLEIQLPK